MRAAGIACLLLALTGTSSAAPPVRSLLEMRTQEVIVQIWDVSCGAAALATLLTYQHGLPVDEETVARAMLESTDPLKVKYRGGFSLLDLKRYADSRGFAADAYLEVDEQALEEMAPAIVPIDFYGYPHFVIYRGRVGSNVLIADPAFGNRVMRPDQFASMWQQNIAFVVQRRDGRATSNRLRVQDQDLLRVPASALRQLSR